MDYRCKNTEHRFNKDPMEKGMEREGITEGEELDATMGRIMVTAERRIGSESKGNLSHMNRFVFLYNGCGWFLKLDSLGMLNRYVKEIWDIRKGECLSDLERIKKKLHPTGDIASVCQILADVKGTDTWHEFKVLRESQYAKMTRMILEGRTLYVNANGGYSITMGEAVNRYESETLMWPVFSEEDIRIKKWPGGNHYYAYIGPIQVKESDTQKWDSELDARIAAMRYVKKKQHRN